MKRRSVRKPGEYVVLRKISNALGFPLSYRNVTQHGAILHLVGALPAGEARLDREDFAVLSASFEFRHPTTGHQRVRAYRIPD